MIERETEGVGGAGTTAITTTTQHLFQFRPSLWHCNVHRVSPTKSTIIIDRYACILYIYILFSFFFLRFVVLIAYHIERIPHHMRWYFIYIHRGTSVRNVYMRMILNEHSYKYAHTHTTHKKSREWAKMCIVGRLRCFVFRGNINTFSRILLFSTGKNIIFICMPFIKIIVHHVPFYAYIFLISGWMWMQCACYIHKKWNKCLILILMF